MSRCLTVIASMIVALAVGISGGGVFGGEGGESVNKYNRRDGSWKAWRIPDRDAINSLYLLAKHCGVDCTYQDARNAFGGYEQKQSLLDIRDAAHALGLNASVYRCSSAALGSLKVPVIAHMEGNIRSKGHFSVLLPRPSESVPIVINGYTTQLTRMKTDKLLRKWDGFMLKPEHESIRLHWVLAACSFLLLAGIRIWLSLPLSVKGT